jgi:hypothetical protein
MATPYNRNFTDCFPFSDTGVMMTLVASTALTYTVPGVSTQKYRANFSINSTVDVWVRKNGTAVLPTSGTATATYNQEKINSVNFIKYVNGGDTLSFISPTTPEVGVSFLQIENNI